MRILYLDDSGKIHPNDSSKIVVFGGFSVDEGNWHRLIRRISGAKAGFFPHKGAPSDWEVKSVDFLSRNAWNRAIKRKFCFELVRILGSQRCSVYVVSMEKAQAKDALAEAKFVPMALQRLVAKFHDEVVASGTTGSVVMDWSTHQMDHHVTNCVTAMTVAKELDLLRGGVTYGSSEALPPLQVADIVSAAWRRHLEGQPHMKSLTESLADLRYANPGKLCVYGHPVNSVVKLF